MPYPDRFNCVCEQVLIIQEPKARIVNIVVCDIMTNRASKFSFLFSNNLKPISSTRSGVGFPYHIHFKFL